MATDPICGMKVDEKKAAATYEFKGNGYYFCAVGCKEEFSKTPEKYLQQFPFRYAPHPTPSAEKEGINTMVCAEKYWILII